jgi:hypothetical protein
MEFMYMIVFGGDTIADYTIYTNEEHAKQVMKEKYSKYDCYVIHLPLAVL